MLEIKQGLFSNPVWSKHLKASPKSTKVKPYNPSYLNIKEIGILLRSVDESNILGSAVLIDFLEIVLIEVVGEKNNVELL